MPALVEANQPGLDPARWIAGERTRVDDLARSAGAVSFRGFAVQNATDFATAMTALSGEVLEYGERSSPRSEVAAAALLQAVGEEDLPYQTGYDGRESFSGSRRVLTAMAQPVRSVREEAGR